MIEPTHFESLYPETARFEDIDKILSFIKNGNSCQIIGLPGIGRSNILGMLAYNKSVRLKHLGENNKWFHFVVVNFSEIQKRPLFDATKFIFLSLIDSLRERKMNEEYHAINDIFKESLSFNDELVLFQGLKRAVDFLAIEKQLTIVFLFDRFETYIPMLTSEFFTDLRSLRNRAKYRFSIVFSLERPLEEVLDGTLFADYYEFVAGHIIYLTLSDKVGIDFRISYLEKLTSKKIEKQTLDDLLKLTGGHGKLVKIGAETILATNDKKQLLDKEKLKELLMAQKAVLGSLWETWNALLPEEQSLILNSQPFGFAQKKLSTLNSTPYLEKVGIVKNEKITIPLFEEFVKTHINPQQTKAAHLIFDSNTNNILKGEQVLSDKLTSAEFKLLRFFLQNPDKIIDREEIITAVWKDAKSTAGVTDQAVDQLIFRLRKKIEDDPNNAKHLETIKGRGFRFIP